MNLVFDGSVAPTTSSNSKVEYVDATGCIFRVEKNTSGTAAGGEGQGYIGATSVNSNKEFRLYKGQKVTFSKAADKTISYVEVGVSNSNGNFEKNTFTNGAFTKLSGTGSISIENSYIYKITPTDGTNDIVLEIKEGAQRFSYVKIVLA